MSWLTNLLSKIPPTLQKPLLGLIVALIAYFAAKYGITIPPAVNTTNNVVTVADADPGFLATQGKAAAASGDFHPRIRPFVRAHLGLALAERDHLSIVDAFAKVRKVSNDDLDNALALAAIKQGVYGQLGDGTFLQKILDFLNSPQGQALIKLLLTMLMAFAEPAPQHAMLWDPVGEVQTCQVPYPLAWARPLCALAS